MIKKIRFIDLDLPSGNLWCDRNIGSTCFFDAGNIYSMLDYYGNNFNYKEIPVEKDIVALHFKNNNIRLPSRKDFYDLLRNTYTRWDSSLSGRWQISKKNKNKKIFLPQLSLGISSRRSNLLLSRSGYYYLSRTRLNADEDMFWCNYVDFSGNSPDCGYSGRIRPVQYDKEK